MKTRAFVMASCNQATRRLSTSLIPVFGGFFRHCFPPPQCAAAHDGVWQHTLRASPSPGPSTVRSACLDDGSTSPILPSATRPSKISRAFSSCDSLPSRQLRRQSRLAFQLHGSSRCAGFDYPARHAGLLRWIGEVNLVGERDEF